MRRSAIVFSESVLLVIAFTQTSFAQTSAEVNGYVRDETGAYLLGAKVEIRNLSTSILRSAESNRNGFYRLMQLSPGEYELSATAPGFSQYINREIVLEVRQILNIDVTVRTKTLRNLNISSPVDVTESEVSQIIDSRQIEGLPINGRRFVDFALLSPNVALSRDGRASNNQIAEGGLAFGGMRSWMNNFMIDGIESNNLYNGGIVNSVSQEAVREFQVIAGNYGPDLGRTGGGVVNIVTKSGSNDFHGNMYYFLRNDALDAHPGLARKGEDHFRQNQFGLTLGGPIRRNNSFFFFNYEGQRKDKQVGFSSAFIQNVDAINRRKADFGLPREDPSVVPSDNYDELFVRVDSKINDKVSSTFRYNRSNENTRFQFVGGSVLPSAGEDASIRNQTIMGSSTALLTDSLVNELRGAYSRRSRDKVSSSGFETGLQGTALLLDDVGAMGHQQTNVPTQSEAQIELTNHLNYFRGNHHIKLGVGFNRLSSDAVLAYFDPPFFRTTLAGFLASPPVFALIVAQEARTSVKVRATAFSGFVQDSWRVYPKLTINYGMRYDVEDMNASQWASQVQTEPPVGQTGKRNFQPRIGLAYSMADGRIVVRSGFGIFYDKRITQNALYELTFNPFIGAAKIFSPVGNLTETFLQFISGSKPLASQFGPLTGQGIDINSFINPYSTQWSLGIEHSIGSSSVVGISYLGTKGTHLISQAPGALTNIAPWDGVTLSANGLPDYQFRRIDPRFSQYRVSASEGNSIYHGMSINAKKRFSSSFAFNANYTFSKTIDDSTNLSGSTGPQDPYRRDLERGLSSNDVRHRLTLDLTAAVPKTFPRVLHDFSAAVITTLNSGRPYSFRVGADLNHDFNNATDRVGLSGRDVLVGPGFASVDLRISRQISLSERLKLEVIGEAFNLFNRFNIQDVNDVYGRATFAQPPLPTFKTPTSAFDPRDIQLAVKVRF